MEELAVLKAVGENPYITQEALKKTIGKSISTVKRLTISLQKKGILVRKNGKRDGYWEVLASASGETEEDKGRGERLALLQGLGMGY